MVSRRSPVGQQWLLDRIAMLKPKMLHRFLDPKTWTSHLMLALGITLRVEHGLRSRDRPDLSISTRDVEKYVEKYADKYSWQPSHRLDSGCDHSSLVKPSAPETKIPSWGRLRQHQQRLKSCQPMSWEYAIEETSNQLLEYLNDLVCLFQCVRCECASSVGRKRKIECLEIDGQNELHEDAKKRRIAPVKGQRQTTAIDITMPKHKTTPMRQGDRPQFELSISPLRPMRRKRIAHPQMRICGVSRLLAVDAVLQEIDDDGQQDQGRTLPIAVVVQARPQAQAKEFAVRLSRKEAAILFALASEEYSRDLKHGTHSSPSHYQSFLVRISYHKCGEHAHIYPLVEVLEGNFSRGYLASFNRGRRTQKHLRASVSCIARVELNMDDVVNVGQKLGPLTSVMFYCLESAMKKEM